MNDLKQRLKARQVLCLKGESLTTLSVQIRDLVKVCQLKVYYGARLGDEYTQLLDLQQRVLADLAVVEAVLKAQK